MMLQLKHRPCNKTVSKPNCIKLCSKLWETAIRTHPGDLLLSGLRKQFHIHQRRADTLQRSKLRVNAEGEQHQEEEDGPELSTGELIDRFREYDECQSSSTGTLKGEYTVN